MGLRCASCRQPLVALRLRDWPQGGGSSVYPGLLVTRVLFLPRSCMFEPEGNACSLTDSTAEEHVLALVEHAADEARDRISRLLPGGKVAAGGPGEAVSC